MRIWLQSGRNSGIKRKTGMLSTILVTCTLKSICYVVVIQSQKMFFFNESHLYRVNQNASAQINGVVNSLLETFAQTSAKQEITNNHCRS
jgi:hypothetical protein